MRCKRGLSRCDVGEGGGSICKTAMEAFGELHGLWFTTGVGLGGSHTQKLEAMHFAVEIIPAAM